MGVEDNDLWRVDRRDFLTLSAGLVAAMSLGVTGAGVLPGSGDQVPRRTYTDPILKAVPEIKPVGIGTFAGALDYSNLSWIYKKILQSKEATEGDFRDWSAIRAWARDPVWAKFTR